MKVGQDGWRVGGLDGMEEASVGGRHLLPPRVLRAPCVKEVQVLVLPPGGGGGALASVELS